MATRFSSSTNLGFLLLPPGKGWIRLIWVANWQKAAVGCCQISSDGWFNATQGGDGWVPCEGTHFLSHFWDPYAIASWFISVCTFLLSYSTVTMPNDIPPIQIGSEALHHHKAEGEVDGRRAWEVPGGTEALRSVLAPDTRCVQTAFVTLS